MTSLFDLTIDPNGIARNNFSGSVGWRFSTSSAWYVAEVSIWQDTASAVGGLRLYDDVSGTLLWGRANPILTGTVPGWRTYRLTNAESLSIGALQTARNYVVALYLGAGNPWFQDAVDTPTPAAPLTAVAGVYNNGDVRPTTTPTNPGVSVSLEVEPPTDDDGDGGGGAGLTVGDVQNVLASWLSETDITHTDSLPALNRQALIDVQALITQESATIQSKVGPLQTYGTATPQGVSFGLELVRQQVANLPVGATTAELNAAVTTLSNLLDALEATLQQGQRGTGAATLVDESDFTEPFSFAVAADYYLVELTSWPDSQGEVDLGVKWLPRAGWCAPFHSIGHVAERQYVEWSKQRITPAAGRAEGLLLYCKPGVSGHVRAYQYQ